MFADVWTSFVQRTPKQTEVSEQQHRQHCHSCKPQANTNPDEETVTNRRRVFCVLHEHLNISRRATLESSLNACTVCRKNRILKVEIIVSECTTTLMFVVSDAGCASMSEHSFGVVAAISKQ